MFKKLIDRLKVKISWKEICAWFAISFVGVLCVFLFVLKKPFDSVLLIETLGFAFVFVLMMAGTKSYAHFLEGYQNSFKK